MQVTIKKLLWWVLPVLATGLAYGIGVLVLRRTPITTDEQSYIFQAWSFIEGTIARPCPPFPAIFEHVMIILDQKAGWLSRYPPGHALWIALGILLRDPWLIVAIGAGLSTIITGLAARRAGANAPVAMMLMLASPFFIFSHGTLLSHTSGLLAASLLLFCYVSWVTTRSIWWAALAGGAWGWLFLGRTYTGFLIAIPFGIHAFADLYANRRKRLVWIGVLSFAFVASCGVLMQLTYNWAALGDPLKMTYLYYDPREQLGFGADRFGHSWKNAWVNFKANGVLLDSWLWGFPFGLVVWGIAVWVGWVRRWTPLCLGCMIFVWGGYLFFYYPGPHEIGPGYYLETLPFMVFAATFGFTALIRSARRWPIAWRRLAVAVPIVLLCLDLRFSLNAAKDLRREFGQRADMLAFLAKAPQGSLIFVRELYVDLYAFDKEDYAVFNPRGLGSDPLVVKSMDGQDKAVMNYFTDKTPYDLESKAGLKLVRKDPFQPYKTCIMGDNMHRTTGANEHDAEFGVGTAPMARSGVHEAGALGFGRELQIFPGRFKAGFDIKTADASSDQEVAVLDVAMNGGRVILGKSVVRGSATGNIGFEFDSDTYLIIEPRVFYTGTGSLTLAKVTIEEVPRKQRGNK